MKEESIKKLDKLDWEKYWKHLVKQHSQWLMLCFLTDAFSYMMHPLSHVVYTGQLRVRTGQPPEVQPMIDILQLKERMSKETTLES